GIQMIVEGDRSVHSRNLSGVQRALPEVSPGGPVNEAGQPVIPRRADDGPAPLSFLQERLWRLEQLDPGSPRNHRVMADQLEGPLDANAFERAWDEIVRRHAQLRSTFA